MHILPFLSGGKERGRRVNPQPTSEPKRSQVETISLVGELNTVHVYTCIPCVVCI